MLLVVHGMWSRETGRPALAGLKKRLFGRGAPVIAVLDLLEQKGNFGSVHPVNLVDLPQENPEIILGLELKLHVKIRSSRHMGDIPEPIQLVQLLNDMVRFFSDLS